MNKVEDMLLDDYLQLLNPNKNEAYNLLNHLLWYLQKHQVVKFNEYNLDELYNAKEY